MKYKGKNLYVILDQKYDEEFIYVADWKKSKEMNYVCIADNPLYHGKIFALPDDILLNAPIVPVINAKKANRALPFRKVAKSKLLEDGPVDVSKLHADRNDFNSVYGCKGIFKLQNMFHAYNENMQPPER